MDPVKPNTHVVDSEYYEVVPRGSFAARLLGHARMGIYHDFLRLCSPGRCDRILDVGVSDVVGVGDNVLEWNYPYQELLTGVGLGEGAAFAKAFPRASYKKIIANEGLPFRDHEFSIAFCNAVVEHVGSVKNQKRLVDELMRVAQIVFIAAPNRYFPVEHHTLIPLFGWWPASFRTVCRIVGKSYWSRSENLILMSRPALCSLASTEEIVASGYTGIRLGVWSSNTYLVLKGRSDSAVVA